MATIREKVLAAFNNGPALVGVGAVSDKGLAVAEYHDLPIAAMTSTPLTITRDGDSLTYARAGPAVDVTAGDVAAFVAHNLAKHDVRAKAATAGIADPAFVDKVESDIKLLLATNYSFGMYEAKFEVNRVDPFEAVEDKDEKAVDAMFTAESINRALTYYAAKGHVKWQTNHCTGGRVPVGAMASIIKAYYAGEFDLRNASDKKARLLVDALYWVLHPVNERLCVAIGSGRQYTVGCIRELPVPPPMSLGIHTTVRHNLYPAGTHHIHVAYEGVRVLSSFGIAKYLPNKGLITSMLTMKWQVEQDPLAYHPAATFWGHAKRSINQKSIDLLLADVGYALQKICPHESLSASPIFDNMPAASGDWQKFVNAVKAAMEHVTDTFMKSKVVQSVAGSSAVVENEEILRLLFQDTDAMSEDEKKAHLAAMRDAQGAGSLKAIEAAEVKTD